MRYPVKEELIYTIPGNVPMRTWRRVMPFIPREYLDCTIYLYPTVKAASDGASYGGSGFLATIPFAEEIGGVQRSHVYAVTNRHVISPEPKCANSPVIRLNTMEGATKILPKIYGDWISDWLEDDLAVCMLDDTEMYQFRWIAPDQQEFITEEDVINDIIGIGSDVITIGRFVGFDGKTTKFTRCSFWKYIHVTP